MVLGPATFPSARTCLNSDREAKFEVLALTLTDGATKKAVARPYADQRRSGAPGGSDGLSGAPTKKWLRLAGGWKQSATVMQELQGQVDAVILLSHAAPN